MENGELHFSKILMKRRKKSINVRVANPKEIPELLEIRRIVFVVGQNCPPEEEYDGFDKSAVHFSAFYGKKIVGTSRYREVGGYHKLERFAVLKEYRGLQIGARLVETMLQFYRRQKNLSFYLNSQEYAIPFYEKFGFHVVGDRFYEADIPHFKMILVK